MSNDGGVPWLQAESQESIDTFLVGLAGSDDDDFEDPLSVQPPRTNSTGSSGAAAKLPRKDALRPGTKPSLSQNTVLQYKWTMTNHGWMDTEAECEEVENSLVQFVPRVHRWKLYNREDGVSYKGDPTKVSKADIIC